MATAWTTVLARTHRALIALISPRATVCINISDKSNQVRKLVFVAAGNPDGRRKSTLKYDGVVVPLVFTNLQ